MNIVVGNILRRKKMEISSNMTPLEAFYIAGLPLSGFITVGNITNDNGIVVYGRNIAKKFSEFGFSDNDNVYLLSIIRANIA